MELKQAYLMSLKAGMDMFMQNPIDDIEVNRYFEYTTKLLDSGELNISRLDDAVRRILAVKLAM
jgi:beta-glucosidase-like glycosyl hydrolase